ncbi:MAG: hypothetical protein PHR87_08600 [Sulfurospirillaceae bacterium]|nr:hypothetical protein [Sulfurospirillaceae bacterium]
MIQNSILICDEQDASLGSYFKTCLDYAEALIDTKDIIKKECISSQYCDATFLDIALFPKHKEKTLFVIMTHGTINCFLKNASIPFIEDTINCECINGGLVYSIACSTGEVFGSKIVEKNGSFYGYNKPVEVLPQYQKISRECDMWGLHGLVAKNLSLEEAKKEAQEKYSYYIDRTKMLDAARLRKARDSIVIHGNTNHSFF